jgi:hypothetical protein
MSPQFITVTPDGWLAEGHVLGAVGAAAVQAMRSGLEERVMAAPDLPT